MSDHAIALADVYAAAERLADHAHRTPIHTSAAVDAAAGRQLYFKCENLQRVGAFKFRGAMNAIAALSEADAARGVITHSSGNHAQALALAARIRGIDATVVMPTDAPEVKKAAVRGYGARIVDCQPNLASRESTTAAEIARTGATLVHAYDNPFVMAGQGTAALELLAEIPDLDAIIAPVGGGGLMSGTAIATRGLSQGCRVFAGEPAGADDAYRSKATGVRVAQHVPDTVADGLRTTLGTLTWPIVRDLVEEVFRVEDDAILAAMQLVHERMKLVIEPSAAVPLAAVLSDRFRALTGIRRVGVILSGGNLDLAPLYASYRRKP